MATRLFPTTVIGSRPAPLGCASWSWIATRSKITDDEADRVLDRLIESTIIMQERLRPGRADRRRMAARELRQSHRRARPRFQARHQHQRRLVLSGGGRKDRILSSDRGRRSEVCPPADQAAREGHATFALHHRLPDVEPRALEGGVPDAREADGRLRTDLAPGDRSLPQSGGGHRAVGRALAERDGRSRLGPSANT